jgi:hypothetical protein
MKKLLYACAVLVLAFGASKLHAADVTGSWKGEISTPDGGTFPVAYTLKQDGATLTGTTQGPQGDEMSITDGKVDGNKVSFKISFNGMTIVNEGTVSESGDEIKLTTKSEGGEFPAMELTLKRDKAAAPAAAPAQ